jgi:hypothetical protein
MTGPKVREPVKVKHKQWESSEEGNSQKYVLSEPETNQAIVITSN